MATWDVIPEATQTALVEWLNITPLSEDDRIRLEELYHAGRFWHWRCPHCGEHVYHGDPENWDHFQNAWEVDWISYPGDPKNLSAGFSAALCNSCRASCALHYPHGVPPIFF